MRSLSVPFARAPRTLTVTVVSALVAVQGASARAAWAQPTPSPAQAATTPALDEARQRHASGRSLIEASPPDYNAALAEFRRAYELMEGHPRRYLELSNIGRCYQGLGQYDRAMEFYERYLREGGDQADDRAQVEASIRALRDILGTLVIETNVPEAEVWVDSRQVGTAPGRVHVPGGRHVVELRARGHAPSRQEVELASQQTVPMTFSLEVLGRAGLRPTFFWITAGVAAAAAATGGVFGVLALSARSDVDARLASTNDATRFSVSGDDAQHIRTLSLTADVLFASGAALAIGATVLAFLTDWHGASREGAPRPTARLVPSLAPSAAGVQLVGSF